MGESKVKVESFDLGTRVVAATKIPRGCTSSRMPFHALKSDIGILQPTIQVGVWRGSEIQPVSTSTSLQFWANLVRLAPDCHAQNAILVGDGSLENVVIEATKDIQQGQEVLLWFEEGLLAKMGIPSYLSPSNIYGGDLYICHACKTPFQDPNHLKIHIALNCGGHSMSILWKRLTQTESQLAPIVSSTILCTTTTPPSLLPSLPWTPLFSTRALTPVITTTSFIRRPLPLLRNGHFQPLPPPPTSSSTATSTTSQRNREVHPELKQNGKLSITTTTTTTEATPSPGPNRGGKRRQRAVETAISVSVSDPEAQLESIVSNMGKARNGHMCLYCGKLYSRKYGLKIHIRTHTGYKPLRCKICLRPFGDPSNLNKHIRLHSDGNTPYRCEICSKVLVRKRDLERHIRSRHTNNPPQILPIQLSGGLALNCRRPSNGTTTSH